MKSHLPLAALGRLLLAGFGLLNAACVGPEASAPPRELEPEASLPPAARPTPKVAPAPAPEPTPAPPPTVAGMETRRSPTPPPAPPPRPANCVVFFSEPGFRGESFIVEVGGAVENLARLPAGRGGWSDRISSFRIEGIATVVAYSDAYFRGHRLETSSSLGDLVAESRGSNPDANWDRTISSLRVVPPRGQRFNPEPGYDIRTAENVIRRAYRDILGRDPDRDGMQSYLEKVLERGWSEEDVRQHIHRSAEFRALNPDEIITRAYREVLKREPDPEGLRHYRDLLTRRGWTIPQIRADLLRSAERSEHNVRTVITRAYREILGRDPDPEGYANYERAMRDKGWGEQQVRDSLKRSEEYRQKPR
jgi:hypothetical protein